MKKKKKLVRKSIKKNKGIKKALNAEKQALLNSILRYSEGIAYNYYLRHFRIFANDVLSIHDLYQEAKIICLQVFKKYHRQHNKNGFDIKKFIGRAVGWRMRDLMRQAITESKVIVHQTKNISTPSQRHLELAPDVNEANHNRYDILSPELLCGFNIEHIFKRFNEKDLTCLKFMIKYNDEKHDYTKFFRNRKLMHVHWNVRVKPRLKAILLKYKEELDGIN